MDTTDVELAWMLEDESRGWMRFDGMVDPDVTYSVCCLVCRGVFARRAEDPTTHEFAGAWLDAVANTHLPCAAL